MRSWSVGIWLSWQWLFSLVTYVIGLYKYNVDYDGSVSFLWFTQLVQLGPGVVAMYGVMGFSVGIPTA